MYVSPFLPLSLPHRSHVANSDTNEQKVTPREFKPRISRTKGHLSKRTMFVREIVKEVAGYVIPTSRTRRKSLGFRVLEKPHESHFFGRNRRGQDTIRA